MISPLLSVVASRLSPRAIVAAVLVVVLVVALGLGLALRVERTGRAADRARAAQRIAQLEERVRADGAILAELRRASDEQAARVEVGRQRAVRARRAASAAATGALTAPVPSECREAMRWGVAQARALADAWGVP